MPASPGWREWLTEPNDGELVKRLRRCTQTGWPCGSPDFVAAPESALNRTLALRKRGRKPRSQGTLQLLTGIEKTQKANETPKYEYPNKGAQPNSRITQGPTTGHPVVTFAHAL
jgi:hypothetical protein